MSKFQLQKIAAQLPNVLRSLVIDGIKVKPAEVTGITAYQRGNEGPLRIRLTLDDIERNSRLIQSHPREFARQWRESALGMLAKSLNTPAVFGKVFGHPATVHRIDITGGNHIFLKELARNQILDLNERTIDNRDIHRVHNQTYSPSLINPEQAIIVEHIRPYQPEDGATFIFNLDHPQNILVYRNHVLRATGMEREPFGIEAVIDSLKSVGKGKKLAVIVGQQGDRDHAKYYSEKLKKAGVSVLLVHVDSKNANMHVSYLPDLKAVVVAYGDGSTYYRGDVPLPFNY